MEKQPKSLILKIIISIYGLIYFAGFVIPMVGKTIDDLKSTMPVVEIYTVPLAGVLFVIGATIVWFDERIGGILLLFWHFIVWFFSMYLWREAGMVLILIFPMLYPPVLLILNWYKKSYEKYSKPVNQWKLVLNVLMANYFFIYILIVIAEVIPKLFGIVLRDDPTVLNDWNYNTKEIFLLIALLILFVTSSLSAFKSVLISGILLVLWYILLLYLKSISYEFADSGPWLLFSLPILIQGVLYIYLYYLQIKPDKKPIYDPWKEPL